MRFFWLACAAALWGGATSAEITGARYDGPTERYAHGVLGEAIEHDTLVVTLTGGREMRATYSDTIVFEDTAPRLVDVTGDGAPEIIAVESHDSLGARLAVWGLVDGKLAQIATTPHIGTRFRWLAPAGVAATDLDGDGTVEIAYVDRPHLAKTLRVWRFAEGALTEVGSLPGVTNHRIGERDIAGGIRDCGQGPEIVVADANWRRVLAVRFDGSGFDTEDLGAHQGRESFAKAMACDPLR